MNSAEYKKAHARLLGKSLLPKFARRGMEAMYCDTADEARRLVLSLIPEGSSVGWGGSLTISESGILDAVKDGPYRAIDRDAASSTEERYAIMRSIFDADYFLMSTNAFTKDGELVNIDGNGNRIACLAFGPRHVIVVAGMNKLADNVSDAFRKIHTTTAPENCIRLGLNTPCTSAGICGDCHAPDCTCCQEVVTRHSREKGRIRVILVGESLGL
ncbi:MAG: lactate utilization protein [Lachnospiraceae bacterium]|jgi:L-lactate utilization protein LutB|nr:lactate utilization protein [Lachnospiraceae bacterium]MCI1327909.1 lactate utilization protein [Lachnospiraceae bacterium]